MIKRSQRNSGGPLFLELAFKAIPRDKYMDLVHAKQNSPDMTEDVKKEINSYLKEFLEGIAYDLRDLRGFEEALDFSLTNTSNRRKMLRMFLPVAREVAEQRAKSVQEFWDES